MNKGEFLTELKNALSGLPQDDIDERLSFYGEMIDDRIEEGASESEAIAGIGSVSEIVSQTVADIPITRIVKEKIKPKRSLRTWEVVLIVLGFPVWFPLLISAGAVLFAVLLSVYVVIWAVIVTLWAVEVSFVVGSVAGILAGILFICLGNTAQGLLAVASGLVLAGLSVFLFFGCRAATKGAFILTKKIALGFKSLSIGKGSKQ